MTAPTVRKIPSLSCPQCGSTKVSKGFTKVKNGMAVLSDGKVYCYDCKKVTTKAGKVIPFEKQDWYLSQAYEDYMRSFEEKEKDRAKRTGETAL